MPDPYGLASVPARSALPKQCFGSGYAGWSLRKGVVGGVLPVGCCDDCSRGWHPCQPVRASQSSALRLLRRSRSRPALTPQTNSLLLGRLLGGG